MAIQKKPKKNICVEETSVSSTEIAEVYKAEVSNNTNDMQDIPDVEENNSSKVEKVEETNSSESQENDVVGEIEFPTMRDGTDISQYDLEDRIKLSNTSLEELKGFRSAYEAFEAFNETLNSGNALQILSGDYKFPENNYHIFMGFIIQVRENILNGNIYAYLDILIGNDSVKTIRFQPSKFSDAVSKGLRKKLGFYFSLDELYGLPVRLLVQNTLDENGNVEYSSIKVFHIMRNESIGYLIKYSNELLN